jgi:hypothetical protein
MLPAKRMQERIMHMQYKTDTALLGDPPKHVGAFRSIMNVQNISPLQSLKQGTKNVQVDSLLYHPWRSVQQRVNLMTPVPSGQPKQPAERITPGVIEGWTDNCLVPVSQNIGHPSGDGAAAKFGKVL